MRAAAVELLHLGSLYHDADKHEHYYPENVWRDGTKVVAGHQGAVPPHIAGVYCLLKTGGFEAPKYRPATQNLFVTIPPQIGGTPASSYPPSTDIPVCP
ncbi:hypothetical protein AB0H00_11315 [Nocardia sp. NPDC023852]|uniref:hypothetical protein n=1 Tax=Nocardia sp. NPDC023852 TaxID=3154697 RepID=UPI0034044D37